MMRARDFIRGIRDRRSQLSDEQIIAQIQENEDLKRSVITAFNFWQDVWIAITTGRANEPVLKQAFASAFVDMYCTFKHWLDVYSSKNDPVLVQNISDLAARWANGP